MKIGMKWVLSKDMATLGEYLQTWKLQLSTTKTVSAAFHLNNKGAKRELKVNYNNGILSFCPEPKYPGVTSDRSLTYRRHLESIRKKLTSRLPLLGRLASLGCWSNKVASSHPIPGELNRRILRSCLVLQCSYPPHWPRHQQRLANYDWMPASYTSAQPYHPRRHPTCWASQWSHTVSSTPCQGAQTPAPHSAYLPIECKCATPQIETPICTRRMTTHQFIWQQHTCGAQDASPVECGVGRQPYKTPHFHALGMTIPRTAWVRLNRVGRFRSCLYNFSQLICIRLYG